MLRGLSVVALVGLFLTAAAFGQAVNMWCFNHAPVTTVTCSVSPGNHLLAWQEAESSASLLIRPTYAPTRPR